MCEGFNELVGAERKEQPEGRAEEVLVEEVHGSGEDQAGLGRRWCVAALMIINIIVI